MLDLSQIVANATMATVSKEEEQATIKAKETQAIADDAQRDLNEALPALVGGLQYTWAQSHYSLT